MSDSGERVCLCGHDHLWLDGQRQQECVEEGCECEVYRPVLPWPDAEGDWRCDQIDRVVAAYRGDDGHIYLDYPLKHISDTDHGIWVDQYEFELHHPKARFTRLIEPNPFV